MDVQRIVSSLSAGAIAQIRTATKPSELMQVAGQLHRLGLWVHARCFHARCIVYMPVASSTCMAASATPSILLNRARDAEVAATDFGVLPTVPAVHAGGSCRPSVEMRSDVGWQFFADIQLGHTRHPEVVATALAALEKSKRETGLRPDKSLYVF